MDIHRNLILSTTNIQRHR